MRELLTIARLELLSTARLKWVRLLTAAFADPTPVSTMNHAVTVPVADCKAMPDATGARSPGRRTEAATSPSTAPSLTRRSAACRTTSRP